MKPLVHHSGVDVLLVAPFTGAWIETTCTMTVEQELGVAPFTGAWIETRASPRSPLHSISVAPFTGAWIETIS